MCKGVAFSLCLFLCLSLPLAAQTGATATVLGTVTDASGAVVAGATVTATNTDTQFVRNTKSGGDGAYTIFALPIGRYSVRAEATGFRASEVQNVTLTIDQKAQVDFQLVVGQVSETVTVTGEAPVLKTEDSSTSQVILEKAIVDLPLNGRDFMQLTRLTANVNTGDGYNITSGSVGTVIKDQGAGSVYGQRNSNNVFRLDGIQIGELTGNRSRLEPNMDAIQEFTLIKGIYPAEFGTVAGATVNVAIKSGTNALHGALFEFLRNDALDTRNFFDRTGSAPNLRRNQFGGMLGGPVIKNKTFFFGSYDGLRLRQANVSTTRVPTPSQLQGDLSSLGKTIVDPLSGTPFSNGLIPASRIDPISKALGGFWPAPNNPADPTRNFISAFSEAVTTNQYFGRVDHRLTDKDQVFARYGYAGIEDSRPPVYPPFAIITHDTAQSAVLAETHTFSPTLLNEARFGYTRVAFTDAPLKTFPDFPAQFNLAKVTRDPVYADLPIVGVSGYTGIGSTSSTPDYSTQNNFEFVDNVMLHRGPHSFKFGIDLLRRQIFQRVPQNKKGTFTFDGNFSGDNLGDFLLGLPRQTQVGASPYISTGNLRMTNYGIYAQDDWHVSSRLTLNLGLRYEVLGAPVDIFGLSPNFDPLKSDFEYAPFTKNTPIYHTDRNNFAPRFGFAFRPFNDNKTVVRGGYGIYFNANNYDEFLFLPYNPPFGNVLTYQSLPNRATLSLSNPFPETGASAGAPAGYGMDQHLQMGYVQSFTFGVEREIARNTVLEVSYVGSKSTRLAKAVNVNFAPMGAGAVQPRRVLRQDLGNVAVVEPWSNSTYHSLQIQLERQLSRGLMLLSGYAYGKALDDVAGSTGDKGGSTAQNPYCINSCEKGPPAYDLRQRFTANVVYELPFGRGRQFLGSANRAADALLGGWDVASIIARQSGRPLTLTLPGDPLNTGNGNGRPNYLGGPVSVANATINQWFNTAAFGAPAPYTPGNTGRGIFLGPGLFSWDFAVYKTFAFTERHRLQFRTEFFNFPNHANFGNPGTTLNTPTFGQITSAGDPRTLQFGLKYLF